MKMNQYDFKQKVKTCGSFTIWKPENTWDNRCLVKAICPSPKDEQMVSEVARRLTNLQIAIEPPSNRVVTYAVKCHPVNLKGLKRRVVEVFTIVSCYKRPIQDVIDWVEKNCSNIIIPGLESSFDTSRLSVGPCAYRDGDKSYVKVRFDGISIPFYFNKTWDRTKTHSALTEQNGPALAADLIEVLAEHQTTILERAFERPFNLSGVAESATHVLTYWIESPPGVYQRVKSDSPLLAVPENNIVLVAEYGWDYRAQKLFDFVLLDGEIYRIPGYHEMKSRRRWAIQALDIPEIYEIKNYRPELFEDNMALYAYGEHMLFKKTELIKLDPDDNFVREKLGRTLKAKL